MSLFQKLSSILPAALALFCLLPLAEASAARTIPTAVREFSLPQSSAPVLSTTPQGQVLLVDALGVVRLESERASGQFQILGQLPDADFSTYGASFAAVSPDGQRLAVGNGGGASFTNFQIGIFDLDALEEGRWLQAPHYLGIWWDNQYLLTSGGSFGSPSWIRVLNADSPLAESPEFVEVVNNIGGASGAVALDQDENLWTGNGFSQAGPSQTGAVHMAAQQEWTAAFLGEGEPVDFETQATPVLRALSAASLAFDGQGNLWVGGGVTFGDNQENDFAAFVEAPVVASVLAKQRRVLDSRNNGDLLRFDPQPEIPTQRYQILPVAESNEVILRGSGTDALVVYAPREPKPAPLLGSGALALLGAGLLGGLSRRRRSSATA